MPATVRSNGSDSLLSRDPVPTAISVATFTHPVPTALSVATHLGADSHLSRGNPVATATGADSHLSRDLCFRFFFGPVVKIDVIHLPPFSGLKSSVCFPILEGGSAREFFFGPVDEEEEIDKKKENIIAYSTVMDSCAKSGEMGTIVDWLSNAQEPDMKLDIIAYNAAIEDSPMSGDMDKAVEWFVEGMGSPLFRNEKGQNSRIFLAGRVQLFTEVLAPRSFLQAYLLRCSRHGSFYADIALRILASDQHCATLQECRLLTCSFLLMASFETRIALSFSLFRLAYLFPLFPPSASMCHDTDDEDPLIRSVLPGEVVVVSEDIYVGELVCDPVPDCISVSRYTRTSVSPIDALVSELPDLRCPDVSDTASCVSVENLVDDSGLRLW